MAKNVHVIPHMHWDREWYFTTEESRILLVNNMEEIMQMLETRDDYPYYILDGQTAILEDYFDVKPENRARVEKLAKAGKLIIGPWYTQTDEMVVGGESIVRNLLYGLKDSKEFGDPMMIGYLPDSFGQSEKLPQILNGFDIKNCMFWRGASERHGSTKHNFNWKSQSEGEVLVQLLPLGYAIGKYLEQDKEKLGKRMDKYLPVLDKGAMMDHIILPNGHDQMPVQQDIFEVMDVLREMYPEKDFFLSNYDKVFDELEKVEGLDTLEGELLDGKYMRVHRSIFSTRADIKASNTRIENKLSNVLEPLMTMAYELGVDYEEGLVEAIWKEIMKNHAHDSIGCCCSDKVHQAIVNRFFEAEDKTDELIRFYKRKIVDAMSCERTLDKVTAFNFLPYKSSRVIEAELITKMKNFNLIDGDGNKVAYEIIATEVVDAGLIDRQIVHYGNYDPFIKYTVCVQDNLPAMGYKTYLVEETEGTAVVAKAVTETNEVENKFYKVAIQDNGTLVITDKNTNEVFKNVLLIEDGADDGDEYDFSPLPDDFLVTSANVVAKNEVAVFEHKSVIKTAFTMDIPKDLDSRKAKVCDSTMDIAFTIELQKDSPTITLDVDIENRAGDHRVRVLVPSNVPVSHSKSDNQFGMIKRTVVDSAMEVWESEGWDERPDSIYPMLSYVAPDTDNGLAVLTNSVREYELIGEGFSTLAITLFRSVGFLGKEEMVRRPGRPSGIKMPTPDSQMIGSHHYDIAITSSDSNLPKRAKEYVTPVVTYNKMPYNAMKLNHPGFEAPYNYSFLEVSDENFILSAVKKAQGKDGIVVRGYQSSSDNMGITMTVNSNKKLSNIVNLNEDVKADLKADATLELPMNVVKSYYIK